MVYKTNLSRPSFRISGFRPKVILIQFRKSPLLNPESPSRPVFSPSGIKIRINGFSDNSKGNKVFKITKKSAYPFLVLITMLFVSDRKTKTVFCSGNATENTDKICRGKWE